MTGYLLDTNVAIVALAEPDRLSAALQSAILRGPNVLSVVSFWEVLLKSMRGNLMKVGDPRAWWRDALEQLAATPLVLRPDHVAEIYTLPDIHKDPFDRALIAQASVEALEIVTLDTEIPRYASSQVRVLY
ncbi:MAG: type II toxin-antitoxin system VapC family toxin [Bryobacteraceae bacterium]